MVVKFPVLRVAATLGAAATWTSPAVPCRGAYLVAFRLTGTNGNAPQSYTVQVRANPPGGTADAWVTVAAAAGAGARTTAPTPAALNAGGQVVQLGGELVTSGQVGSGVIAGWDEARIQVLGHATLTITGFACDATVSADENLQVNASVTS